MYEMTRLLVNEWSKFEPHEIFNPYVEFNKFALDVIAKVGFDIELKSIEIKGPALHPFAEATTFFLSESGKRAFRPAFVNNHIFFRRNRRYWKALETVRIIAKEAIDKRRSNGRKRKDILNAMLNERDPVTGKQMTEDNRIFNTLGLLGAGMSISSQYDK